MHGNVWEWVEDVWHGSYKGAPADGAAWTDGEGKESSGIRIIPRRLLEQRSEELPFRLPHQGTGQVIGTAYQGFRVARTLD